ncbi:MAG: carbohydrate kinase [Rhodospirillales bacterium]|nr:MAG: carbohydrate kinase [Rhodospirillales bacterium]
MARIAVVGSVASDEVIKLDEPLREGTHLTGKQSGARLGGGAACTAVPLAYAGHEVAVFGSIGRDDIGDALLAELAATGVITAHIARLDQPSTRSLILLDGFGERTIVNLQRTHEEQPPDRLLGWHADWVYVRSRRLDLASLLERQARSARVIAHVPPSEDGARPAHVLITSASDVGPEILEDPFAAGRRIAGDHLQWMVVTRGARGAVAHGRDAVLEVPARKVTPVDTTGAGDSFAAGLVHALADGAEMAAALECAVAWGAEATLWESSVLPRAAVTDLVQ